MNDRDIQGRRAGSEPPRLLDLAREAIRRRHYQFVEIRLILGTDQII